MPFVESNELNKSKFDILIAVSKLDNHEIKEDIMFIFDNIVEHLALYKGELVFSADAVEMLAMLARTPEDFQAMISIAEYMRNDLGDEPLH